MALQFYGLLTGTIVSHQPQAGGNPHYLLNVKAKSGIYRVAVNLESTDSTDAPPQLQYQILDLSSNNQLIQSIEASKARGFDFTLAQNGAPTLDFVRDGLLDMSRFTTLARGANPAENAYQSELVSEAEAARNSNGQIYVAVFGTGYSDHGGSRGLSTSIDLSRASIGFNGVDNIHMNQGSFLFANDPQSRSHYNENGPNQDGAVLFFHADGTVKGFFTKFQSQDTATTAQGKPVHSGVPSIDANFAETLQTIKTNRDKQPEVAPHTEGEPHNLDAIMAKHKTAPAAPQPAQAVDSGPADGFIFEDPDPTKALDPAFETDDDSAVENDPTVKKFQSQPEPVPAPIRSNLVLKLSDVLSSDKIAAITNAGSIAFDVIGDSGGPTPGKLTSEETVTSLMLKGFSGGGGAQNPSYLFHVGDVVYYFGEENFYFDQFFQPFQAYPAPIFAIPGNHDCITYSPDMQSLKAFEEVFVGNAPQKTLLSGGIKRTTMTQPGVYFTLEAPFVTTIGLFSNSAETNGWLNDVQLVFLTNELKRLKPLRESGEVTAVLLAVHHPLRSVAATTGGSQSMSQLIDAACTTADFYPDACFSGHAHVYQRLTRVIQTAGGTLQMPLIVTGAGGYAVTPSQEVDKSVMNDLDSTDPTGKLHKYLPHHGYVRVTVTPATAGNNATLQTEYRSPELSSGAPQDVSVLDLNTHQVI